MLLPVAGWDIADGTVTTLKNIQNNENFDLFWKIILPNTKKLGADDPKLPRKNQASQSLNDFFGYGNGGDKSLNSKPQTLF